MGSGPYHQRRHVNQSSPLLESTQTEGLIPYGVVVVRCITAILIYHVTLSPEQEPRTAPLCWRRLRFAFDIMPHGMGLASHLC
jgi:hypothetical protein